MILFYQKRSDIKVCHRVKFFQQYRLFFRYHIESKVIVYVWVNDERTKRAFNRKTDAYRIFRKMLEKGHPPNNWEQLIKEAKIETTRLKKAIGEK